MTAKMANLQDSQFDIAYHETDMLLRWNAHLTSLRVKRWPILQYNVTRVFSQSYGCYHKRDTWNSYGEILT